MRSGNAEDGTRPGTGLKRPFEATVGQSSDTGDEVRDDEFDSMK
jgi:hypothetical protein